MSIGRHALNLPMLIFSWPLTSPTALMRMLMLGKRGAGRLQGDSCVDVQSCSVPGQ